MNRYRYLAFPAYIVALSLIIIPFFDAGASLWPWRPGVAQWRFGAIGLASNAFLIPSAGLLVLLATALTFEHRTTLRIFGIACGVAAVLTGVSILFFSLDAMQTRADVTSAARLSFHVASLTAVVKLVVATAALVGFAMAGLRAARERRTPAREAAAVYTTR
jgi:hypothetical protein